jgi:hypothetical protein
MDSEDNLSDAEAGMHNASSSSHESDSMVDSDQDQALPRNAVLNTPGQEQELHVEQYVRPSRNRHRSAVWHLGIALKNE